MIEKPKRIEDKKLIDRMRQPYCEHCGRTTYTEVHHVKSVGSGGDDVRDNLISLCRVCHMEAHTGYINKPKLKKIIRERESYAD